MLLFLGTTFECLNFETILLCISFFFHYVTGKVQWEQDGTFSGSQLAVITQAVIGREKPSIF